MKVLGLATVFICCTLFGVWVDGDERKRLKEMEEFIYLFELLKGEIDYQMTPMIEACQSIALFGQGEVKRVFLSFASEMESQEETEVEKMWHKALRDNQWFFHLKEEDYRRLESFGSCCGYLDKNMQQRNLEMILEQLRYEKNKTQEKYERCSKLNRYLGMLIGGALVIFLI